MCPSDFSSRSLFLEAKEEEYKQRRRVPLDSRRRVRRACLSCRAKKIRCSGSEPCQACIATPSQCKYADSLKERTPSKQFVAELSQRQKCFEYLMELLCPSLPHDTRSLVKLCKHVESSLASGSDVRSLLIPGSIDQSVLKVAATNNKDDSSAVKSANVSFPSSSTPPSSDSNFSSIQNTDLNTSIKFTENISANAIHVNQDKVIRSANNLIINSQPILPVRSFLDALGEPIYLSPTSSTYFLNSVLASLQLNSSNTPESLLTDYQSKIPEDLSSSLLPLELNTLQSTPTSVSVGSASSQGTHEYSIINLTSNHSSFSLKALKKIAHNLLPPVSVAERYANEFFLRYQSFFYFYPPSVFSNRYQILADGLVNSDTLDTGFLAVALLIVVLGHFSNNNIDVLPKEVQLSHIDSMIQISEQLISSLLNRCTLSSIQAVFLLSLYHFLTGNFKCAYSYLGFAIHSAHTLGLEHGSTDNSTLNEVSTEETSIRICWSLRVLASFLYIQSGITPIINLFPNGLNSLKLPTVVPELEARHLPSSVFHFVAIIKYAEISVRSLNSLYESSSDYLMDVSNFPKLLLKVERIYSQARNWKLNLTHQQLNGTNDTSDLLFHSNVSLHLFYHYLIVKVSCPIMFFYLNNWYSVKPSSFTKGLNNKPSLEDVFSNLETCYESAKAIVQLSSKLLSAGQMDKCFYLEFEILYCSAIVLFLFSVMHLGAENPLLESIYLLEDMGSRTIDSKVRLEKLKRAIEIFDINSATEMPINEPLSASFESVNKENSQSGYMAWQNWVTELSSSNIPLGHALGNPESNNSSNSFKPSHPSQSFLVNESLDFSSNPKEPPFLPWSEALLNMDMQLNRLGP